MAKSTKEEVTVIAEFEVSSSLGTETIRGFSASWRRVLELPTPARANLIGWARIDRK